MRVLITGAAGNIGSILAKHLLQKSDHQLNLMWHKTPLDSSLIQNDRTKDFQCDLSKPETLNEACSQSDVIVHFAGILFAPGPKKFLPITNTVYNKNLVDAAIENGVKRYILISFPHVEGPTSINNPATDRQDKTPKNSHSKTRLEAEKYVIQKGRETKMEGIALRPGMIYGKDILMIAFAKKLAQKKLLGVWKKPTPVHLLSIDDFNACCQAAIENPKANGIYSLGDDDPTTLQGLLDTCCDQWGLKKPWRVPLWSVYIVAWLCETYARIFKTRTPFTVDFIKIGRVPYFCDTSRMKEDLLPRLKYPSLKDGMEIL